MSKRFGRNQRRAMREEIAALQLSAERERQNAHHALESERHKLAEVLRHHMRAGTVPVDVEYFIEPREMNLVMHAIYDERRANLHYQHAIGPQEMRRMRDGQEREMFGIYLGRMVADALANAIAAKARAA